MINMLLDMINWFINVAIPDMTFPVIEFNEVYDTIKHVLYYPVKVFGLLNITIFFTLLNLDWILTLTLGVVKTVLKFIRGN